MKVNKFQIDWQLTRVKAKAIKDVAEKIEYVWTFLKDNPTYQNYVRVLNWIKTTGMAYKDENKESFEKASRALQDKKFPLDKNEKNDFSDKDLTDLKTLLLDLQKRKYDFQFKKTPQDHVDFVERLEKEIASKSNP